MLLTISVGDSIGHQLQDQIRTFVIAVTSQPLAALYASVGNKPTRIRAPYQNGRSIMRKLLVLLAALTPAVLAADAASASKTFGQCGTEFYACQERCGGISDLAFQKSCFIRCESARRICASNATPSKPGKIEVGGKGTFTPTTGSVVGSQVKVPINATSVPLKMTPVRPGPSEILRSRGR
jgi:hypothetical protein